jgi:mannonate dehydratase
VTDETLQFAAQLGVTDIVLPGMNFPGNGFFDYAHLIQMRSRVEAFGLKLYAIENIPWKWYYKIMFGLPGRDEQIENWHKSLRNMGAAGIPVLGYNFMPLGVWRTSRHTPGRGGAPVTCFSMELAKKAPLMAGPFFPGIDFTLIPKSHWRPIGDDEMWSNFTYFIKAVVPAAEGAGVKMGVHPDDPPISPLGGVARIMRSPEAFRRVVETAPSECNGLEFCQGCFSEMGTDVIEAIRYFGSRKKIFYVHFRDVRGFADDFCETFIDEGQVDMFKAMKAYHDVGFEGVLIDDHTPHVVNDTDWGHRGRAYSMGYMAALKKMVESLDKEQAKPKRRTK